MLESFSTLLGALAQLGERFAGSEEVIGSIPLCSTKFNEFASILHTFSFNVLHAHFIQITQNLDTAKHTLY